MYVFLVHLFCFLVLLHVLYYMCCHFYLKIAEGGQKKNTKQHKTKPKMYPIV